jgi:predicted solute-binding protein
MMDWLDQFELQEDALISRSIPLAAQRLGLPEAWFEEYYQCLRRVLRTEDLEGQALFLEESGGDKSIVSSSRRCQRKMGWGQAR